MYEVLEKLENMPVTWVGRMNTIIGRINSTQIHVPAGYQ
jgi:hypothetical protein